MSKPAAESGKAQFDPTALLAILQQLANDAPQVLSFIQKLLALFGGGSSPTPAQHKEALAHVKANCCDPACCDAVLEPLLQAVAACLKMRQCDPTPNDLSNP